MTKNVNVPEGYQAVMPYLILQDAQKFVEFAALVFHANENISHRSMRDGNTIMHTEIIIGGSTIMLADSTEKYEPRTTGLFVYVDDADTVFLKALSEGASCLMEVDDQPYGRSGGVLDPFGNTWWITSVSK